MPCSPDPSDSTPRHTPIADLLLLAGVLLFVLDGSLLVAALVAGAWGEVLATVVAIASPPLLAWLVWKRLGRIARVAAARSHADYASFFVVPVAVVAGAVAALWLTDVLALVRDGPPVALPVRQAVELPGRGYRRLAPATLMAEWTVTVRWEGGDRPGESPEAASVAPIVGPEWRDGDVVTAWAVSRTGGEDLVAWARAGKPIHGLGRAREDGFGKALARAAEGGRASHPRALLLHLEDSSRQELLDWRLRALGIVGAVAHGWLLLVWARIGWLASIGSGSRLRGQR